MQSFFKIISLLSLLFGSEPAPSPVSIVDRARFIFAFGDSFTTNGWTGSGNPLGTYPHRCTSAGPNWALQLNTLVKHTQLIDLAVGGATSDASIISPSTPDFRSQTTSFLKFVAPNKKQVPWNANNAIFVIAFGTNDVNRSYKNTAGNGTALYDKDLTSYFSTVERLYAAGARHFVFNNVVPFDRAQAGASQGPVLQAKLASSINEFNRLLRVKAKKYCASKRDITLKCLVFDTHTLFTTIMDHYKTLGFATPDKFCNAYAQRTSCAIEAAHPSCLGPASSYVWKDGLHPAWRADRRWAKHLLVELSAIL